MKVLKLPSRELTCDDLMKLVEQLPLDRFKPHYHLNRSAVLFCLDDEEHVQVLALGGVLVGDIDVGVNLEMHKRLCQHHQVDLEDSHGKAMRDAFDILTGALKK